MTLIAGLGVSGITIVWRCVLYEDVFEVELPLCQSVVWAVACVVVLVVVVVLGGVFSLARFLTGDR